MDQIKFNEAEKIQRELKDLRDIKTTLCNNTDKICLCREHGLIPYRKSYSKIKVNDKYLKLVISEVIDKIDEDLKRAMEKFDKL